MAIVRNALVVGGGIAGMAAALRLKQRLNTQVEIVELDGAWRVHGTGLTMTGAALRAFEGLGLLDTMREHGFVCSGTRLLSPACTPVSELEGPPEGGPIALAGGIMRPVLHEILWSAVRAQGIAVKLGSSVSSLDNERDRVRVRFEDGSDGAYDLVVGADGIHSRIRGLLFENSAPPRRTGQGCYRLGAIERPAAIDRLTIVAGHPVPLGFIPVSQSHMYMFLLEPALADGVIEPRDCAARVRALMEGLGGVGAEVREQIGPAAYIDYRPLESILVPAPWHRGRVVLIGDAAHATTPHLASGAGLAVEDALVLSEELESAASVEQALAAHTKRRYPRCRAVVETSIAIGATQLRKAPPPEMFGLMQQGLATLSQPY